MNTDIMQFGYCYVLPQVNEMHPIHFFQHDLILYPEKSTTLYGRVKYTPFVSSVVTEDPYVIACYDRKKVKIWDEKEGWISPEDQTYGTSSDIILHNLLGVTQSIPSLIYDGGDNIDKQINKRKNSYQKACKLEFNLICNNNKPTYLS